jgi:uncharacterized protein YdeI (YjbR/CyaY-like superfamily)
VARATRGPDGKPIRSFRDQSSWKAWLEKNHAASPGLWLRLAKKSSNLKSVSYDDAVEVALCYGWIDSQGKGEDENHSLQKFTPRAKRSTWSTRNRERAVALIESGRMKPAGLMEIERAKRDGRWAAAYDSPTTMKVPRDFQVALNEEAHAKGFFRSLNGRNRYAILHQLQTARSAETRARRIERFVAMLPREEKLYP